MLSVSIADLSIRDIANLLDSALVEPTANGDEGITDVIDTFYQDKVLMEIHSPRWVEILEHVIRLIDVFCDSCDTERQVYRMIGFAFH
jgi:hypothetical protein